MLWWWTIELELVVGNDGTNSAVRVVQNTVDQVQLKGTVVLASVSVGSWGSVSSQGAGSLGWVVLDVQERRLHLSINWLDSNTEGGGEDSVTARHGVLWGQSLPVPVLSGSSSKSGSSGGDFLELHCCYVMCLCAVKWSLFVCLVFSFFGCWFSSYVSMLQTNSGREEMRTSIKTQGSAVYLYEF